jgi:hypothetical protein
MARAVAGLAYTVTLSTGLNRTTSFQVTNQLNGDQDRLNTLPDGTVNTITRDADSTNTDRSPEGMFTAAALGPDPRWGMLAPLAVQQRHNTERTACPMA